MTIARVGVVNVPVKVGPRAWFRCWRIMSRRTGVFGVNESLTRRQRAVYAAAAVRRGWGQYGLWRSPNPIFFNRDNWRKVKGSGRVVKLHDAGPWARNFPGYNAARYATIIVLERPKSKVRHAFVCLHFVSNGHKVPALWREQVRATSFDTLREIVDSLIDAGCVTWVMGDTNVRGPFPLGKRFNWVRGVGIDKIGVGLPDGFALGDGGWELVDAPTDHGAGVVARVHIEKEKP